MKISDLFEVTRGKRIVKNKDYFDTKNDNYIFPVITSRTTNNSIDGFYNKYNCDGQYIVCGGEASGMYSTFHSGKFWVMDRSRILKPKFILNKYRTFYFIPLLNANMDKFSYGLSANPDKIENINILIPVDKNNNIDFNYIEEYIKSLPYSKYL